MNDDDCGVKEQFKYTFVSNMTCVKVAWKGCQSPNLFDDESTCFNTCVQQSNTDNLMIQLHELPMDDVKAINNILDNVMEESTENTPEFLPVHQMLMLKNVITVKGTTEAETESTVKTGTVSEVVETTRGLETTTGTDVKETNTEVIETTTEVIEVTTEVKGTTVEVTETTVKAEVTTPETIIRTEAPLTHPPILTNPATLTDTVKTEMGDPEEVVLTI